MSPERFVFYRLTTSASTALRTPRRTCCPDANVLITVPRVSRSCGLLPGGFDLHVLCLQNTCTNPHHPRDTQKSQDHMVNYGCFLTPKFWGLI